ncbi:hypothetical protein ACGFOM_28925 [Streptomyces sp. NPDC048594]|uniref:hypothetical protein n=1 Tax=Streptomyces sp. NPDC048594 TaxID=3365575 RepID=UPI003719AD5F
MQIVVAGQGYAGLPLALRAAEVGHRVVAYDVDSDRVQQLAPGQSCVRDLTSSRLRAVLDSGTYFAPAHLEHQRRQRPPHSRRRATWPYTLTMGQFSLWYAGGYRSPAAAVMGGLRGEDSVLARLLAATADREPWLADYF